MASEFCKFFNSTKITNIILMTRICFLFYLVDRKVMKGLFMGIALIFFAELTGFYTLTSYAVTTFEKVGTTIDPYKSSITLAVALTFGSLATASLADKLGRKALILISLLGASLGLFTVAGYHYAVLSGCDLSSYAWVPMASLSTVIFLASAGIIPLCYICCVETIPAKVCVPVF